MKKSDNEIWVFLSHSNNDYEKVKFIRDHLELDDFRPIMFFLKCLDKEEEIDDLIKREIDARTWFLLCNSSSARTSKWVKTEVKYINSQKNKRRRVINIEDPNKIIQECLESFKRRMNVFISSSRVDIPFVMLLNKQLQQNDFRTWIDYQNIATGANFSEQISLNIEEVARTGYVLRIISEASLRSEYVRKEIEMAVSKGADIISILLCNIDDIVGNVSLMNNLKNTQWICQNGHDDESFAKIAVDFLIEYDNKRENVETIVL